MKCQMDGAEHRKGDVKCIIKRYRELKWRGSVVLAPFFVPLVSVKVASKEIAA